MAFRFNDLMIHVVGEDTADETRRLLCGYCSTGHSACGGTCAVTVCGQTHTLCAGWNRGFPTYLCGASWIAKCEGPSLICGPSVIQEEPGFAEFGSADFRQLRAQLERALADLDERERRQEAALRPQSRAEAERLEAKLTGALDQLRQLKSELE